MLLGSVAYKALIARLLLIARNFTVENELRASATYVCMWSMPVHFVWLECVASEPAVMRVR